MDTYSSLRHFADSWGLLAMFLLFLGIVIYVFRPGGKAVHRDSAQIPLRHGDDLAEDEIKDQTKHDANQTTKEGGNEQP
ncbi:MAG: cbb3-type cytochrome c oxidase subunit 3 [Rhodobacteraceae bacterium]|nr:cbb3-type cytochrome c oxidase subunit 3 [Paracoccaceae bacterium]